MFNEVHVCNNITKCKIKPNNLEILDTRLYIHRLQQKSYNNLILSILRFLKTYTQTYYLIKKHHISFTWMKGVSVESLSTICASSIISIPSILRLQGYEFSSALARKLVRKKYLQKLSEKICTKISYVAMPLKNSIDGKRLKIDKVVSINL